MAKTTLSIRVEKADREWVERFAERRALDLSDVIRWALKDFIRKQSNGQPAPTVTANSPGES